jgi:hypothetical protein
MKLFVVLLLCGTLFAQSKHGMEWGLKKSLEWQGFSGQLSGNVHFTHLGELGCNAKKFRVLYYTWEETNPPGKAIHAQNRIVLLGDDGNYAGSYIVDDRPAKALPNALVFGYEDKLGNEIQCNAHGLPKNVLLDGELRDLIK